VIIKAHNFVVQRTFDIDDELLRKAEACMVQRGKSLPAIVGESLRAALANPSAPSTLAPEPCANGGAPMPISRHFGICFPAC
jgi:hypothetical protein